LVDRDTQLLQRYAQAGIPLVQFEQMKKKVSPSASPNSLSGFQISDEFIAFSAFRKSAMVFVGGLPISNTSHPKAGQPMCAAGMK
jgi:hypothetical protein